MRIAIVGSGISGLVAAWMLHEVHEITVFETESYIGGYTHTIEVKADSGDYAVDTGFIVCNESTYPNFSKILETLDVASRPTQMSFAVRSQADGLEYNGDSLNILQSINSPETFLLSLNQKALIDPKKVLGSYVYHHPAYSPEVLAAQRRQAHPLLRSLLGLWFS